MSNYQIIETCNGEKKWGQRNGVLELIEYSIKYFVVCYDNHPATEDIIREIFELSPESHSGLYRDTIDCGDYDDSGNIEITVKYTTSDWHSSTKDDDEDEPTLSFDCSTGSTHITHGLTERVIKGVPAGKAIGWNGKYGDDMEITGVDVPIAQMQENYTKIIRLSKLTNVYKRKIASLVGKVNSKAFKGWEAGEVMFMGCSYSSPDKKSTKVTVTFNFTIQPNESNIVVSNRKVSKRGWEHIWAISRTVAQEGSAPQIVTDGIYVNQVVKYADFGVLEL